MGYQVAKRGMQIQGVPHLRGFHYRGSHYRNFWLMYVQVGDFHISKGPLTVPLMRILRNVVFLKFQNLRKVGTLYRLKSIELSFSLMGICSLILTRVEVT